MIQRGDPRRLRYIRDAIGLIERRTRLGQAAFLHDVDMQDAMLWRLATLAEATGQLSDDVKERHPTIRWRAIYGFRNIAAHGYLDLQLDRVWEIIEVYLPELRTVVEWELQRLADTEYG